MAEPLYCSSCQEEITSSAHSSASGLVACSEECAAHLDDPRSDAEQAADYQAETAALFRALRRVFGPDMRRSDKEDPDVPF